MACHTSGLLLVQDAVARHSTWASSQATVAGFQALANLRSNGNFIWNYILVLDTYTDNRISQIYKPDEKESAPAIGL